MITPKGLIAFVVDDNPTALETLANDLRNAPEFSAVFTFSNYADATLPMLEEQPDVLFMDVEVPGKSGLDFLQSICPRINFNFKVVFYSGYANYMIDAIRQSAFDFLLKPYKQSELRTIIDRLKSAVHNSVRTISNGNASTRKLAMQTVSELLLITIEQVLMFAYVSDIRSWQLMLTDNSTHILKKGISASDLLALDSNLARISNTCIINLTYLSAVENNTQKCRLASPYNHLQVVASRRYFSKLKEKFELL
ncbi:MAG: LytTR family DNA-binding domain-containing protein [Bacteroidales bacterium]|nr:LytTR family DNA-binding domain-containing protein [Bacteroidales bacterium]